MTDRDLTRQHQKHVSEIATAYVALCRAIDRERAFRAQHADVPLPSLAPASIAAHVLLDRESAVRHYLRHASEYGAAVPALPEVDAAERRRQAEQQRLTEVEAQAKRERERNLAASAERERNRLALLRQ